MESRQKVQAIWTHLSNLSIFNHEEKNGRRPSSKQIQRSACLGFTVKNEFEGWQTKEFYCQLFHFQESFGGTAEFVEGL